MLTIIQITAILQGIFVGFALFQKRQEYKKPIFWLFIGGIVSTVLFAIGDDDYNLILSDVNWFFFHEPLMITFFFLFIRYSDANREVFNKLDAVFFLPYLLNIVFEVSNYLRDSLILKVGATLTELCFIVMLLYSIYDIVKSKKEKWLLVFLIPFTLIFTTDEISYWVSDSHIFFLPLDSYGIFLMTIFLFYFVTYKLIIAPKEILPTANNKYKLSNLSKTEVESIKRELNRLMTEEQLFKNQKLNVNDIATQLGISRQRLSEVLNVHMGMRFQDFLNQHRVEAFIKCLEEDSYKNFTLLGIATEVGFSSKSSFNSTFKKLKGVTPSQYKKGVV